MEGTNFYTRIRFVGPEFQVHVVKMQSQKRYLNKLPAAYLKIGAE